MITAKRRYLLSCGEQEDYVVLGMIEVGEVLAEEQAQAAFDDEARRLFGGKWMNDPQRAEVVAAVAARFGGRVVTYEELRFEKDF